MGRAQISESFTNTIKRGFNVTATTAKSDAQSQTLRFESVYNYDHIDSRRHETLGQKSAHPLGTQTHAQYMKSKSLVLKIISATSKEEQTKTFTFGKIVLVIIDSDQ